MAKIALHNMTGISIGELHLKDSIFGIEPNPGVVQEAVVAQLANQRQGTASTKRRDEVRGGGTKPWRQKGTGRARSGSIRSPLWVGGGVVFGPKPRKYTQSLPKRKKQLALSSVLSSRLKEGGLIVLDKIETEEIKTKLFVELFRRFGITGDSLLIILGQPDEKIRKSLRNISGVKLCTTENINSYDILRFHKIIFDKSAIEKIEKVLSDNES